MIAASVAFFDLGGTLFHDNRHAWPWVYRRADAALWRHLRKYGPRVDRRAILAPAHTFLAYYYALRGNGLEEPGALPVLINLLSRHGISISDAAVSGALRSMYAVTQTNWRVERDAGDSLRKLKAQNLRLGAISNGSDHENALELLRKAKLEVFFDGVLTSALHGRRKPEPSVFQLAMRVLGVDPDQAVMIGDNYEADILGANRVGMRTIWITRRVNTRRQVLTVKPDATVRSLRQIPALLIPS